MRHVNQRERIVANQAVGTTAERPSREPLAFHRRLPGYAPTPLLAADRLAGRLGLARLWVKDESERLGLPAFKILGASWATFRAVAAAFEAQTGRPLGEWRAIDELAQALAPLRPLTLACATDGNHGRAVARMARLLGLDAHIIVPAGMAPARVEAIAAEGARVSVIDGTYDEAIARSAEIAGPRCLVISDTSWPGYDAVPRWVIDGYGTILWEIDDELTRRGEPGPTLVAVQIGVGAFAAAVVRHYRRPGISAAPLILGVEPTRAACVIASVEAGRIVSIPGPHDSIMAGLNCGTPSEIAWPVLSRGIDQFLAIEDDRAREAMRLLASEGIVSGESGAAGLAGLLAWIEAFGGDPAGHRALVLSTEGATDPAAYERIVGAAPRS